MHRVWRLTILLFGLLLAAAASAQDRGPLAPPATASPREFMTSFTEEVRRLEELAFAYRQDGSAASMIAVVRQLDVLRSFFDLSEVPPALRAKLGGEAATELADILIRLPNPGPDGWPEEAGPAGYWTIPGTEIALRELDEGPDAGEFRVTPETVRRLSEFHDHIIAQPPLRPTRIPMLRELQVQLAGPLVPNWLVLNLPAPLRWTVLGTPVWKTLVSLLALVVALTSNLVVWRLSPASRGGCRRPRASRSFWAKRSSWR